MRVKIKERVRKRMIKLRLMGPKALRNTTLISSSRMRLRNRMLSSL